MRRKSLPAIMGIEISNVEIIPLAHDVTCLNCITGNFKLSTTYNASKMKLKWKLPETVGSIQTNFYILFMREFDNVLWGLLTRDTYARLVDTWESTYDNVLWGLLTRDTYARLVDTWYLCEACWHVILMRGLLTPDTCVRLVDTWYLCEACWHVILIFILTPHPWRVKMK